MITLIGRSEKDWLDNRVELFIWKQLCSAFKVDRLIMVGISNNPRITIEQYKTVEEAIKVSEGKVILLEPKGDIILSKFVHPKNAIYIFGNAMNHNLKQEGVKIRIDTPTMTDMFAFNAAAIVLADRNNEYR